MGGGGYSQTINDYKYVWKRHNRTRFSGITCGAGELAQRLEALVALAEDPESKSIANTHTAAPSHLQLQSQGTGSPPLPSEGTRYTWDTNIHAGKIVLHIK